MDEESTVEGAASVPGLPLRLPMPGAEQWNAFCSGIRLEILSALHGLGEASVAEIACATDRSADGLHRHVRVLLEAGLVQECEIRRVGRQSESVYRLAAEEPVVDVDMQSAAGRERMREVLRMVQRETRRTFETALDAEACRNGTDDRNSWVRISQGWLDEDDLRELGGMLDRLDAFFRDRQTRRPGKLHLYSVAVTPVHRERPFAVRGSQRQAEMLAEIEAAADADEGDDGRNAAS